jgi:hypothetical protein
MGLVQEGRIESYIVETVKDAKIQRKPEEFFARELELERSVYESRVCNIAAQVRRVNPDFETVTPVVLDHNASPDRWLDFKTPDQDNKGSIFVVRGDVKPFFYTKVDVEVPEKSFYFPVFKVKDIKVGPMIVVAGEGGEVFELDQKGFIKNESVSRTALINPHYDGPKGRKLKFAVTKKEWLFGANKTSYFIKTTLGSACVNLEFGYDTVSPDAPTSAQLAFYRKVNNSF